MKRNERVVGNSEERFPRPRLLAGVEEYLMELPQYPRGKVDEPRRRKKNKAEGLTVPLAEVGKKHRATGSARESIRSWLHIHGILDGLGLGSQDILVGVDYDPDHREADSNGFVVRIYRLGDTLVAAA